MDRIIAFDVETPNHFNNSICSIGIAIVENGRIIENQHYLVDPEADFDYQNIMIHGIYPEDVSGAPTFPQLWNILGPVMRSGILCAHNAVFDLCVLRKLFARYDIVEPNMPYVCTYRMSQKLLKNLPNHKLNTLSDFFGIYLDHHDAGSDSVACATVLCRLLEAGFPLAPHLREYDFSPNGGTCKPHKHHRKNGCF